MGLSRAKSLLEVKGGLTFLDIIARQILAHRKERRADFPVVFMNSFNTEADTQEALRPYEGLSTGLPLTFIQHRFPKVLQEGLTPADLAALKKTRVSGGGYLTSTQMKDPYGVEVGAKIW